MKQTILKLTCVIIATASLTSCRKPDVPETPTASAEPEPTPSPLRDEKDAVRAYWFNDVKEKLGDYEEVRLSDSDHAQTFVLETDQPLLNFRILAIDVMDAGPGKEPGYLTTELYYLETFTPEKALVVSADLSETIPNTGFCYDETDGELVIYHYLTVNGMDGSLELTPFWD